MMKNNGLFDKMIDEAMERVASDGLGADQKDIMLVGFGIVMRNMSEKIEALRKPLWWLVGIAASSGVGFLISSFLGYGVIR